MTGGGVVFECVYSVRVGCRKSSQERMEAKGSQDKELGGIVEGGWSGPFIGGWLLGEWWRAVAGRGGSEW